MSLVYFLHAPSVNLMKIGFSVDPVRRFDGLRLLSPVPLDIVGLMEGGATEEGALHKQFAHLRSHGEWFLAAEELMQFAQKAGLEHAWKNASPEVQRWFIDQYIDAPVFDRASA